MKRWLHMRIWWHRRRYKALAVMPGPDGSLAIECSCGGGTQLSRQPDGLLKLEYATCPLWGWIYRVRDQIPQARVLKGGAAG